MQKKGVNTMLENLKNKRYVPLDFSNPQHEAYLTASFGGAEHMSREYPVLYGMLSHTKRMAENGGENLAGPKTGGAAGYTDRAHIHEIVLKDAAAEDNVGRCLYSKGCVSLVSIKPVVHVTLEIYRNNKQIARSFRTGTNLQYLEIDCQVDEGIAKDDTAYAVISCFWNEPDSDVLRGGFMKDTLDLESGKYVEDTICDNPRKKIAGEPNAILVSYGRGPAENVDYWYPAGQRDKAGNQKVQLDVNGSVKLTGAVFDAYKSHEMSMFSASKGVILYQGAAPVCTKTENGFTWSYNPYWNDSIQSSVRYGQHLYEFDMRLEFTVTDQEGKKWDQHIDVSSLNSEDEKNTAIIKPLKLIWGCLGKDTLVRMADGSVRKISDIYMGERVATPEGNAAVSQVWTGNEETIFHIKTENGQEILATGDHQFQSESGYVRVLDLTSDTVLLTDGGGTTRVLYCYEQPYHDTVYSLDLDAGKGFYAGGLISGTMERQNTLCEQPHLPGIRQDLKAELEKMNRQIAEGTIFREDRWSK